jgi:hypothetical protein
MVHRPQDTNIDAAVTSLWDHDVRRIARDGDWILSRSYYLVGDVIATVTPGEDLSHASIYDAEHGTVIEAVGDGVRETRSRSCCSATTTSSSCDRRT